MKQHGGAKLSLADMPEFSVACDSSIDCNAIIMESGKAIGKSGIYCCLYHLKNKKKFLAGMVFPRCDFANLRCKGNWHLLKELKEKTREEITAKRNLQRQRQDKRKGYDQEYHRKLKEPKYNKWDLNGW